MITFAMTEKAKWATGSRKKSFYFSTAEKHSTDSYWDGGSRDQFEVANRVTGQRIIPPAGSYPWTTPNDYVLQPNEVLIVTGTFCGKPATPHFICRPDEESATKTWLTV
jgi:hypothetical protein